MSATTGREWRRHAWAAVILGLMLNVFFLPYVWGDANILNAARDVASVTPAGADGGDQSQVQDMSTWKVLDANGSGILSEPAFALAFHEIFVDHVPPLWNPDVGFGAPLAAAMQQQPFFPLALLAIVGRSPTAYAAFILLRLFIAGIGMYAFMRFFVGFAGALAAGMAFMLNGYFVHYLTMPHLSVETLTPLLFFCVEAALRRKSRRFVPALAIVVACVCLGGMPESTFISIAFAAIYAAYRIFSVRAYRERWRQGTGRLTAGFAGGFAGAAFLLLPFAEYVTHSFNVHEASKNGGVLNALVPESPSITDLALSLMPLIFGPVWQAGTAGIPATNGYFGTVTLFLALCATLWAARAIVTRRKEPLATVAAFFAVAVVLLTLKRYGFPLINWIGYLPIVRMIALSKYQEAATPIAVAALAGIAIEMFSRPPRLSRRIVVAAAIATLLSLQAAYDGSTSRVSAFVPHATTYFFTSLALALVALITVTGCMLYAYRRDTSGARRLATVGTLVVLAVELGCNYVVPVYDFALPGPSKARNPYAGAPYVRYLHDRIARGDRVYAEGTAFLTPDWAEAFDLRDVRDIDAMFVDRYLPFGRAFLPPADHDDLISDFGGYRNTTMASALGERLLALGSVRYLVGGELAEPASFSGQLAAAFSAMPPLQRIRLEPIDARGDWRLGFEQPSGSHVDIALALPSGARTLEIAVAPDRMFWSNATGTLQFRLDDATQNGRDRTLFAHSFEAARGEPKGWVARRVDVRSVAGTTRRLVFSVRGKGTRPAVNGAWGGLHIDVPSSPESLRFSTQIGGANVYTFGRALPYGALYRRVTIAPDDATALAGIADPKLDLNTTAIVSGDGIPAGERAAVVRLAAGPSIPARPARLLAFSPTHVAFSATATGTSILFVSDTLYPGWKAFVDGKPASIVRTNYLFRGVVLEAGSHRVEFIYDPLSFKLGVAIAVLALLGLVAYCTFWPSKARGAVSA